MRGGFDYADLVFFGKKVFKYFIYACLATPAFEKSNKNGEVVAKVIYDVLQKPECEYDKM